MTVEICNALLPGCSIEWNAVGAIATAGATLVALASPLVLRHFDGRDRENSLAHALLLKVVRIHEDVQQFSRHILYQREIARANSYRPDLWEFFRPFSNLPREVSFTGEEMAMLFRLQNYGIYNEVMSMDEVHRSLLQLFRLYGEKRDEMMKLLPTSAMSGSVGTLALTGEQIAQLRPLAVTLDELIKSIVDNTLDFSVEVRKATEGLHLLLNTRLNLKMSLSFLDEEPADA
ncbi:MAG: hypothetical protein EOO83_00820 [Oxalobacteraceae bacterium]|nr:MAG: hypothetical protein EOO83_00820 [Oxalobacteraceae bacterium]